MMTDDPHLEIITLAGGCFWCTEAVFERLDGVQAVEPGYTGGETRDPTYAQVCSGRTGHAEAVRVTFDPGVLPLDELLRIFFATHDPTTLNRQGADVGTQYRSSVFYHSPEQEGVAKQVADELERERVFPDPIVTEITSATEFYPAEPDHREYYRRNPDQPYCQVVIAPKVARLREQFAHRLSA